MSTEAPTPEQVEAFSRDYRDLCERHGLVIVYDGGYWPGYVQPLSQHEPDEEDWELRFDPDYTAF